MVTYDDLDILALQWLGLCMAALFLFAAADTLLRKK
jgi:hypothetical protein